MGLIKRKKRDDVELAETTTSANLFKADYEKLEQFRKRTNKRPAEFFREFVHQALIQQELVERQSPAGGSLDSVAIEALLRERLAPILPELQDVKGCMQELALMHAEERPSNGNSGLLAEFVQEQVNETNRLLSEIFDCIEGRHSSFVRVAQLLYDRQERAERWSQAAYVLAARSFDSMSALLDLFERYVLVPQLVAMNPQADAVKAAKKETEASCAAAAAKRKRLERRLRLPKDSKINFLSKQPPEAAN